MKERMMKISRKALVLLSVVAVAAMLSGLYITAHATSNGVNYTTPMMSGSGLEFKGGRMAGGCGRNGFIEVSAEYNQTVITIAESDSDVQNLLAEGYSISAVRPVIKSVVQADGTVVTKATTAIVTLTKGTTGRATVYVDVANGKVTQIVILTRTVIEKG